MISREDLVEQSVTDFARNALFVERGYSSDHVELRESFPYTLEEAQFTKNIIATGFTFDDGGEQAELGSDLKVRLYTVQFLVFGRTATYGRNLAHVLKFAFDSAGLVPLKDIAQPEAPVIDQLIVTRVSAERQIIGDPEPWQEFVWTTTLVVEDTYFAQLA